MTSECPSRQSEVGRTEEIDINNVSIRVDQSLKGRDREPVTFSLRRPQSPVFLYINILMGNKTECKSRVSIRHLEVFLLLDCEE